jgi:4-hydroxybenzoate polyprenyltransferase
MHQNKFFPYMKLARWDKPIGFLLLFFPGPWALFMLGEKLPPLSWVLLFLMGAILTRGAGCTYNDMVDVDFDRHVERTRSRPLAAGVVTKRGATLWMGIQLLLALGVLLCLPTRLFWPALSIMLVVVLYPWVKRFSYFPQVVLGLAFNWGAILGGIAQEGRVSLSAILLYVAGIFWTLGYDTIYAHQDIEDDLRVGVKSTAIFWGLHSKKFITFSYGFFWGFLMLAAAFAHIHFVFYGLMLPVIGLVFYRLHQLNLDNPQACLVAFKQNQYIGLIIAMGLLIAKWVM